MLSAALAPGDRADAVKFALRSVGGIALFLAAADLTRAVSFAAIVGLAIAGGAVISALAAATEMWMPASRTVLAAFKTQSSYAGGFLRASGTFQYANTAAMYWEAALPLTLAVGVWATARQAVQRWRWLATAGAVVVAEALVLSASRAALWVTAFVAVSIALTASKTNRLLRAPATCLAAALIVLPFIGTGSTNLLALRLLSSKEATWLQATFDQVPSTMTIPEGDVRPVELTVRNTGMLTWPDSGRNPVHVSYHWYKPDGQTVVAWDGARTKLPEDVDAGGKVSLSATVYASVPPGTYVLEWDVVQEHIAWFSTLGAATVRTRVDVEPPRHPRALPPLPPPAKLEREVRPARTVLWRAAYEMWRERPVFGAGADRFRHQYGARLGLTTFDDRTHASSLYLETLANTGMIGLLAFAAVLISLAAAFRRLWCSRVDDEATRALMLGAALSVATFLMHGLVDYFHSFTPTYGLFWLLAGLVVGVSRGDARAGCRVQRAEFGRASSAQHTAPDATRVGPQGH